MLVFGHISAHRDVHLNQDGLTLMSSGHSVIIINICNSLSAFQFLNKVSCCRRTPQAVFITHRLYCFITLSHFSLQ